MILFFVLLQPISYRKLQKGNVTSRCEFRFKRISEGNPETIQGLYDAEQEDNEENLSDLLFDIKMFPVLTKGKSVSEKKQIQGEPRK